MLGPALAALHAALSAAALYTPDTHLASKQKINARKIKLNIDLIVSLHRHHQLAGSSGGQAPHSGLVWVSQVCNLSEIFITNGLN